MKKNQKKTFYNADLGAVHGACYSQIYTFCYWFSEYASYSNC